MLNCVIGPERLRELKRLAMQLVLQLPEDKREADLVLEHAATIVRDLYLDEEPRAGAEVVRLVAKSGATAALAVGLIVGLPQPLNKAHGQRRLYTAINPVQ